MPIFSMSLFSIEHSQEYAILPTQGHLLVVAGVPGGADGVSQGQVYGRIQGGVREALQYAREV